MPRLGRPRARAPLALQLRMERRDWRIWRTWPRGAALYQRQVCTTNETPLPLVEGAGARPPAACCGWGCFGWMRGTADAPVGCCWVRESPLAARLDAPSLAPPRARSARRRDAPAVPVRALRAPRRDGAGRLGGRRQRGRQVGSGLPRPAAQHAHPDRRGASRVVLARTHRQVSSLRRLGRWGDTTTCCQPCAAPRAQSAQHLALACTRLCRTLRPGFRVAVEVAHTAPMDLHLQLNVHLLSEQELERIHKWNPTRGSGPRDKAAAVRACGAPPFAARVPLLRRRRSTVPPLLLPRAAVASRAVRHHQPQGHPGGRQGAARPERAQMWPPQQHPRSAHARAIPRPPCVQYHQVKAPPSFPAGPDGSSATAPAGHRPLPGAGAAQAAAAGSAACTPTAAAEHSPVGGPLSAPSSPLQAPPPPPAAAAVSSREDFGFLDLRFTRPSRMMRVYIAFSCTLESTGGEDSSLLPPPRTRFHSLRSCLRRCCPSCCEGASDSCSFVCLRCAPAQM